MAGWTKELADIAAKAAKESKVVRPIERKVAEQEAAAAAEKAAANNAAAQQAAAPAAAPAPQVNTGTGQAEAAAAQAAGADSAARLEVPTPVRATPQAVTPETAAGSTLTPQAPADAAETASAAAARARTEAALGPAPTPAPIPGLEPVTAATATPEARAAAAADLSRLSRASLGDYALDERHMPNFDYIEGSDQLKATMADLAEQNKARVVEAQRGTMTWEQSQALADDLNIQPDAIPQVMTRLLGRTAKVEDILAARQMLASSADRLQQFAERYGRGEMAPNETLDFMRQLQLHRELYINYRGNVTEVARTLNVLRKPVGSDPAMVARMNEMITRFGGDIEKTAAAIRMANSVGGVNKIAQAGLFPRIGKATWNTINRVFVNGILSGPVTHAVNTAGNTLQALIQLSEMGVAARVGQVLGSADRVQVGEAWAAMHGYMNATSDAMRMAARVARTGETLDHVLKFETGGVRTTDILPELGQGTAGTLRLDKIANLVDAVVDAPTARALAAEDEFFKVMGYRAELSRQVWLEAKKGVEAGQLDEKNLYSFVRDLMENPSSDMEKMAEDFALLSTYQNPMGQFGSRLNALVQSFPPLKLIMPFIRTPINIFHESLGKRTPLALFSAQFYKDVAAGGRARDLALTRLTWGSAVTGLVAYMALDGTVTGNGPQNPNARAAMIASGWQPYSIRSVDPATGRYVYTSYARLEPLASIIGATADAMEIGTYVLDNENPLADDDQQMNTVWASVIAAVMNNTMNKTFMKGLSDFVDMANNPQQQAASWARQFAGAFVPYSAAWRSVKNLQDPLLRDARSIMDQIKSGLPGYSETLPPKHFIFGEPRFVKSGGLLGTLSPIPSTTESDDPVYAEIRQLMKDSNSVPVTMPKRKIEGMQLTPEEYEKYVVLSRTEPMFAGQNLHDAIAKLMGSSVYQRATSDGKVTLMHELQIAADQKAAAMLEKQDPMFAARISQYRRLKDQLRYGQ